MTVALGKTPNMLALDQSSGSVVWDPVILQGPAGTAYEGGKIYVESGDLNSPGFLQSYDLATGKLNWSTMIANTYFFDSVPTARNGMIFTEGGGTTQLYGLNGITGEIKWSRPANVGAARTPAVTDTAVCYSGPFWDYALQPATGGSIFIYSFGGDGGGGGVPVVANGVLYAPDGFATYNGTRLDATTGRVLGSYAADLPPAFGKTTGYFLQESILNAISLDSNATLWSFTGDGGLTTSPLVVNDTVIIGSSTGNVYALDSLTGTTLWTTDAGGEIPTGSHWNTHRPLSALSAGDGLLIVPAGHKVVAYALSSTP